MARPARRTAFRNPLVDVGVSRPRPVQVLSWDLLGTGPFFEFPRQSPEEAWFVVAADRVSGTAAGVGFGIGRSALRPDPL